MAHSSSNERKACDAVIRLLEGRLNTKRGIVSHPDQEKRQTAEVDIHVWIGRYEFALEHTVFEAAERVTENFESVFVPIQKHLKEAFPEGLPSQVGHYYLILPVQIGFRAGRRARQRTLDCLLEWIRRNAHALDDESQTNYDLPGPGRGTYVAAKKLGFKSRRPRRDKSIAPTPQTAYEPSDPEIRLNRWRTSSNGLPHPAGELYIMRSLPEDADKAGRQRLRRSFSDKCPKLNEWRKRGAKTVLILESENPVITDPSWVADEVAKLVRERDDAPTEVVLVEPRHAKWSTSVLNRDGENTWSPIPKLGYHEEFCQKRTGGPVGPPRILALPCTIERTATRASVQQIEEPTVPCVDAEHPSRTAL